LHTPTEKNDGNPGVGDAAVVSTSVGDGHFCLELKRKTRRRAFHAVRLGALMQEKK
jgi:hypothetical protein